MGRRSFQKSETQTAKEKRPEPTEAAIATKVEDVAEWSSPAVPSPARAESSAPRAEASASGDTVEALVKPLDQLQEWRCVPSDASAPIPFLAIVGHPGLSTPAGLDEAEQVLGIDMSSLDRERERLGRWTVPSCGMHPHGPANRTIPPESGGHVVPPCHTQFSVNQVFRDRMPVLARALPRPLIRRG